MNTPTIGLSRLTAAACAAAITVISAWAFVSSSASTERDPFQFASIMAANAKVRTVQLESRTSSSCEVKADAPDFLGGPVCLRG